MLLTNLIAAQQQEFAAIESQIQALQERQREIQAFMQQLGSVESKMASAAQLVQEAIASINDVCPGELDNYKELITGLFNSPIASLSSGDDGDDEPDPTPPSGGGEPVDEATEDTTVTVEVPALVLVDTAATLIQQIKEEAKALSWRDLRQYMSDYRLPNKGKRTDVEQALIDYCQTRNEVQLQNMLDYLRKQGQKAA